MTNLVYHLKMHHRRNQYLCARLDTCTDVNLMPVAVYQLMFKDLSLKKLTPSTLEIETYMNDICEDNRFMPVLPIASRKEEIDKGHFLCGQRKWECSIVMQNNHKHDLTICPQEPSLPYQHVWSPQHNKTKKTKHTSYKIKADHENLTSWCECKICTIKNQHDFRCQPINHHQKNRSWQDSQMYLRG